MKLLEDRIRAEGKVREGGVLKVDSFLNHQMDVSLFREMALEWRRLFAGEEITKILTIEASGIAIAAVAAEVFGCRVLVAKKSKTKNIAGEVYTTRVESFTHGNISDVIVSKDYLLPTDRVLIIDDFLANGAALAGLCDLVRQSGATLVGAGIAIEKAFQPGGKMLREKGVRIESLARIASMDEQNGVVFAEWLLFRNRIRRPLRFRHDRMRRGFLFPAARVRPLWAFSRRDRCSVSSTG